MRLYRSNIFVITTALLVGCSGMDSRQQAIDPAVERPSVTGHYYADLATAGLGLDGLRGPAPWDANAEVGSMTMLRQLAIYNNYRALVNVADGGGFGRLYGPRDEFKNIPGQEFLISRDVAHGVSHTVLLQLPDTMAPQGCLVAAPSSGSRGVYGAIGTVGHWALARGCAVVYTDKGTGPWVKTANGPMMRLDGSVAPAGSIAGYNTQPFSQSASPPQNAIALKHAHSQQNPQAHWGTMVLDSIVFAQQVIQQEMGIAADLVIAASISNGGGAVLMAADQDDQGMIDAVVAAEPNVSVNHQYRLWDNGEERTIQAKPLLHYAAAAVLYGPCATLSPDHQQAPWYMRQSLLGEMGKNRCARLAEDGLIEGESMAEQAAAAQARLIEAGLQSQAASAQVFNTLVDLWRTIAYVYAHAHGQLGVEHSLCELQLGNPAGSVLDHLSAPMVNQYATSSGVPPFAGVELTAPAANQRLKALLAPSDNGRAELGYEQARCLHDTILSDSATGTQMRAGARATQIQANAADIPMVILHGRSDALVWPNHSSRAYASARMAHLDTINGFRYIEVDDAQHFDTLLQFPEFAGRFVPLHAYLEMALDQVWAHLQHGDALPASQRVSNTRASIEVQAGGFVLLRALPPLVQENPEQAITLYPDRVVIE